MFDFDTAVQTALSPVVTIPVIAALTLVLGGTIYDSNRRLRAQATKYKIASTTLLKAFIAAAEKEMDRRSSRAIEFTYDSLRNIGWDKLARGEVSFEDILFGALPSMKPRRSAPSSFDLQELRDALSRKPRFTDAEARAHFDAGLHGTEDGGTSLKDEDADPAFRSEDAAEGNGGAPRPYHTARMAEAPDFSTEARSPRAG